jgi:hypothetical protein
VTLPNVVAKIEAEIKVVLDGSAEDVLILLALIAKDAVVVADLVFVPLWLGCEREALVDSAWRDGQRGIWTWDISNLTKLVWYRLTGSKHSPKRDCASIPTPKLYGLGYCWW